MFLKKQNIDAGPSWPVLTLFEYGLSALFQQITSNNETNKQTKKIFPKQYYYSGKYTISFVSAVRFPREFPKK